MKPSARFLTLLSPLFALSACHSATGTEPEVPPQTARYQVVKNLLPDDVQNVDLLFVVDNSGSMQDEQTSIAAWADESLFGVLGMPDGSPLNLHVAVVSTDLGAGPYGIQGCEESGDSGQFVDGATTNGCAPISDGFLSDVDDLQGGRLTNYQGTLGEAFACMAQVGTSGCGFEQPLEAMKRALDGSNPANSGFLREDALLAVVIVSDEDDCSVIDTSLFDTDVSMDDPTSAIGALSSFRCFDFGVECAGDDPRVPGAKSDCAPRSDSAYLATVGGYVEFLEGLKEDPGMVHVAGIFGGTETVSVSLDGDIPVLDPSCASASGVAMPGVRLQAFLDGFPDRNRFASVCTPDMSGPLGTAAAGINATVGRGLCVAGSLKDIDSLSPGLQPDCQVTAVLADGRDHAPVAVPECTAASSGPCFQLAKDTQSCGETPSRLALDLSRAGTLASGHQIELQCLVP